MVEVVTLSGRDGQAGELKRGGGSCSGWERRGVWWEWPWSKGRAAGAAGRCSSSWSGDAEGGAGGLEEEADAKTGALSLSSQLSLSNSVNSGWIGLISNFQGLEFSWIALTLKWGKTMCFVFFQQVGQELPSLREVKNCQLNLKSLFFFLTAPLVIYLYNRWHNILLLGKNKTW